jgi:hypothetical protein
LISTQLLKSLQDKQKQRLQDEMKMMALEKEKLELEREAAEVNKTYDTLLNNIKALLELQKLREMAQIKNMNKASQEDFDNQIAADANNKSLKKRSHVEAFEGLSNDIHYAHEPIYYQPAFKLIIKGHMVVTTLVYAQFSQVMQIINMPMKDLIAKRDAIEKRYQETERKKALLKEQNKQLSLMLIQKRKQNELEKAELKKRYDEVK